MKRRGPGERERQGGGERRKEGENEWEKNKAAMGEGRM